MRPNLAFADADAGPLGPKVYNFAVGEKPVVLGCADLASPPDSWTAAKNFEFEFDGFSDFRLRLVRNMWPCQCDWYGLDWQILTTKQGQSDKWCLTRSLCERCGSFGWKFELGFRVV